MQRALLIADHLRGHYSVTELAQRYGVCRPPVYKWIEWHKQGGAEALAERSRARRMQHAATSEQADSQSQTSRVPHRTSLC